MLVELIEKCSLLNDYGNNSLRTQIEPIIKGLKKLEATADNDYFDAFSEIELEKGTLLLREGDVSRKMYFMDEGLARHFAQTDKQEITIDFCFPSEFIDAYDSSAIELPSYSNIELMTDSKLHVVDWSRFRILREKYPLLVDLERMVIAIHLRLYKQRIIDFQSLTAAERYSKLIERHPYIIHLVSVSQIASYLGITIETLSRIRAKQK